MTALRALGLRLSALHAIFFLSSGFYVPFFPVWLQSKGLNPATIGLIVAIPTVIRVFVVAPLLTLSDKGLGARRLLIVFNIVQAVGFPLLWLAESGFAIMAIVAVVSVAQASMIPANDLVTTNEVQRHPGLNYGLIRGAGSIAFLLASICAGNLLGLLGTDVVIVAITVFPILGIAVVAQTLPPDVPRGQRGSEASAFSATSSQRLPLILYCAMFGGALTQSSHGALNAFGSIYWQSAGFSDATIGYYWATGVLGEIIVFLVLGRLVGRAKAGLILLLIGAVAAVLRFTSMSLHPGLAAGFVLQAMHGLSFGASHLGVISCFAALAPQGARGRAQGIYGSAAAFATVATTVASGEIYRVGGSLVFAAMVPLAFAGAILILIGLHLQRTQSRMVQPQSVGSGG